MNARINDKSESGFFLLRVEHDYSGVQSTTLRCFHNRILSAWVKASKPIDMLKMVNIKLRRTKARLDKPLEGLDHILGRQRLNWQALGGLTLQSGWP